MSSADTNPGIYPGNSSLPREVRDKILSTFRHTLNLYKEGKIDDCIIGCDFILKMDPRFVPARKLLEKSKNPNADVNIDDLESLVHGTMTRQERVVAAEPDRLLVRAVESYNARDFDAAALAAEQVLAVLPGNQDAVEILEKARRKKSAQPQVEAAKQKAIAALQSNRPADARVELDRMKALDPDHPAVALLEPKLPAAPAAASPIGGLSLEPEITFDSHSTMAVPVQAPPAAAPKPKPPSRPPVQPPPPASDGLDGLSLDGLSLDASSAPPQSVEDWMGGNSKSSAPVQEWMQNDAPAAPPGSPADMWGEPAGGGLELAPLADDMPAAAPRVVPVTAPSFDLGSFDTPAAPPPSAAPAAALDLGAIGAGAPEADQSPSEKEIASLLHQGDEAAKRGDRQQAIEIWSRIFLIDINNSEAVIRIEKSRQDMAEGNRKIADCLKSGREAFEAGELAVAREMFQQVLAVDPNEPTAKFYLDRIEEELATQALKPAASAPASDFPEAEAEIAPAASAAAPARTTKMSLTKILIPAAIFVLLAGGAVFFVTRLSGPKAGTPTVAASKAFIDDANTLVREGKTQEAIAVLKKILPTDSEYPRAKKLLDQLTKQAAGSPGAPSETPAAGAATTPVAVVAAGPATGPAAASATAPLEPAQLRAIAEKALNEKRYIDALKNFNLASKAFTGDPIFLQRMNAAAEKVAELTPGVKLFNEGEYDTAITVLWRILREEKDNQDARSYLLRSYYNQGISYLQNGLFPKAIESFKEVLNNDPNDTEAQRHKKFAERYQKTDLDLMGRIYVRHLSHRP